MVVSKYQCQYFHLNLECSNLLNITSTQISYTSSFCYMYNLFFNKNPVFSNVLLSTSRSLLAAESSCVLEISFKKWAPNAAMIIVPQLFSVSSIKKYLNCGMSNYYSYYLQCMSIYHLGDHLLIPSYNLHRSL